MRAVERLGALALLALSLAVALSRPQGAATSLLVLAATLAAVVGLARLGERGGAFGLLRDACPVVVLLVVFAHVQAPIEAIRSARYDALFSRLDDRWMGGLVQAWRGALGRPDAFTDAAYVVYCSFYLLPLSVVAAAWARRDPEAFQRACFVILLGFCLSFVGYFLWPTSGPRVPRAEEAALGGHAISRAARDFLYATDADRLDAFPSGHTAMSMLSAWVGTRLFPRAAPLLWAWAAAIVFTTVYVHVHYAVDLLGGVLLFGLTLLVAPWVSGRPRGDRRERR